MYEPNIELTSFRRNGLGVKSKSQLQQQPQKHHKPAAALDTTTTPSARMISIGRDM
ncbi:hypothetical protein K443DRAFT_675000 [Laccaria amethystina LaAM-08-1]|uniref:Uncharacterized protein n=1 Tax=Laccaria amethystina LaAM-08-1 TaxID=1095629 RepID=A0A0C9Y668_9AGAR|nr:hypothetical protein K443DRAFT_675000 [Laccaria amethystina LaAM-08-1]